VLGLPLLSCLIEGLICVMRFLLLSHFGLSLTGFEIVFGMILGFFEFGLFLCLCTFYKYFRRLYYAERLLSIGKKLGFIFNFIFSPEMGHSAKMSIFLSNLFTGKKVVCHCFLDRGITFQGC
jgi:hypothetical protein